MNIQVFTTANIVYMKRFVKGITSKSMVTTEDKITAYATWLQASHTSYTLDRYMPLKDLKWFYRVIGLIMYF